MSIYAYECIECAREMNGTAELTVKLENRSCNIVNVCGAESGIKREKKRIHIDISMAGINAVDRALAGRVVDLNRARILDNDPLKWMSPATRERDDEDLFPRGDIHTRRYTT